MGHRYVEIFQCRRGDLIAKMKGGAGGPGYGGRGGGGGGGGMGGGFQGMGEVIRIRGLPFNCAVHDVGDLALAFVFPVPVVFCVWNCVFVCFCTVCPFIGDPVFLLI